jgi:hypothetical protein
MADSNSGWNWGSDWYQDCDTATTDGAHIGGQVGGVTAGVADIAAAFATAETPPVAYETLVHATEAAGFGTAVGTGLGATAGYAECEVGNGVLDGLHTIGDWFGNSAPPAAPAWDSGMASNTGGSAWDFHSVFSDVPSYTDTHASDVSYADTPSHDSSHSAGHDFSGDL